MHLRHAAAANRSRKKPAATARATTLSTSRFHRVPSNKPTQNILNRGAAMAAPGAPSAAKGEDATERRLASRDVEVRHALASAPDSQCPFWESTLVGRRLHFSWAVLALPA